MWLNLRRDIAREFARLQVPDIWGVAWLLEPMPWSAFTDEQKTRWSDTREKNRQAKMAADPKYAARVKRQRKRAARRWVARQKKQKRLERGRKTGRVRR